MNTIRHSRPKGKQRPGSTLIGVGGDAALPTQDKLDLAPTRTGLGLGARPGAYAYALRPVTSDFATCDLCEGVSGSGLLLLVGLIRDSATPRLRDSRGILVECARTMLAFVPTCHWWPRQHCKPPDVAS